MSSTARAETHAATAHPFILIRKPLARRPHESLLLLFLSTLVELFHELRIAALLPALFLPVCQDVHPAVAELAGHKDEVLDPEIRLGVLLEVLQVVVINRNLGGEQEAARFVAALAEEHQQPAVAAEDLDVIEGSIDCIETTLAVERDALR